MKNIFIFLFLTFSLGIFSQIEDPVKWSTSVKKVSDTEFILISEATIEKGWHLYSQDVPDDGPIPTTFTYDVSKGGFSLDGNTIEEEGHTIDDPIFGMRIKFFENSAVFKQKIKTTYDASTINGVVEFMVCDDSKCLAPTEIDLVFNIPKKVNNTFGNQNEMLSPVKWKTSIEKISKNEYDLIINAELMEDWHLYSQYTEDGGALPIIITKADKNKGYQLVGKAIESATVKKFSEIFKVEETFFEKKGVLKQRIKLNKELSSVTLNLTGQVCKEACIQIDENFTFSLNGEKVNSVAKSKIDNAVTNSLLYGINTDDLTFSTIKCDSEVSSSSNQIQQGGKTLWSILDSVF